MVKVNLHQVAETQSLEITFLTMWRYAGAVYVVCARLPIRRKSVFYWNG